VIGVATVVTARLNQKGNAGSVYIVTLRAAGVLLLPHMKEEEVQRKFVPPPLSLVLV
jgi:hypothetical protein